MVFENIGSRISKPGTEVAVVASRRRVPMGQIEVLLV